MKVVVHVHGFPMETLLRVSNVFHAVAHDGFNTVYDALWSAHFAPDNHAVGCGERLASHARHRVLSQKGIKDGIRDPVADFYLGGLLRRIQT